MQHMITDEEVKRFDDIYVKYDGGSDDECVKAALTDFLANRPESTLGKLRPIAEMPETVPEGCVRYYACEVGRGGEQYLNSCEESHDEIDTYAVDIFLQLPTPDPEAEERQRFEEWVRPRGYGDRELKLHPTTSVITYEDRATEMLWLSFKAGKLAKSK